MRHLALALAALAFQGPPIVGGGDSPGELGAALFAANCVRCHGVDGRGRTTGSSSLLGPPLRGVGARAADFYLRTGYMPLEDARDQPRRSRVRFSERELRALIGYVASLGGGPEVPRVDPGSGNVAEGRELFTEHCAGCHQVVAQGGVLTGAKAPPLDRATPVQVAQAVRIGPYAMPPFPEGAISDAQLNSIVAYVEYAKNPRDDGGWGIGHLGPFPEGMVTWLIAMVVLVAACLAIGKRRRA